MHKKIIILVLFIASVCTVLTIAIHGFSQVLAYFKSGAEKSDILLLTGAQVQSVYQPKVNWLDNPWAEGRKLEQSTKRKVISDYVTSYYYQYQSSVTKTTKGIKDYFTKKTRAHFLGLMELSKKDQQENLGTTIEHFITPKFYSEDGSLMVVEDQVISYNKIIKDQSVLDFYDSSSYEVMLLLEDDFWRVRHKVRNNKKISIPDSASSRVNNITIRGDQFMKNEEEFKLKCINYYPQDFPWEKMWQHFEEIDFEADLQRVKSAGFNSIRIFVPFHEFGGAQINGERLWHLNRFLDLTDKMDIKVVVTLFDFFLGYDHESWTLSDRHAEQIIKSTKEHSSILAWDLKNEPDLDFESIGESTVKRWLEFMIRRIRYYDDDHFITIGWSQPEASLNLVNQVDFSSFHFYRDPDQLKAFFQVNEMTHKPVFVGEIGMHSYDSWWFPFGKSESEQAQHTEKILHIIRDQSASYGLWTLYDFRKIPANVVGRLPWRRNPQKCFGIFDKHEEPKKIYDIILNFNCNEKESKIGDGDSLSAQ